MKTVNPKISKKSAVELAAVELFENVTTQISDRNGEALQSDMDRAEAAIRLLDGRKANMIMMSTMNQVRACEENDVHILQQAEILLIVLRQRISA